MTLSALLTRRATSRANVAPRALSPLSTMTRINFTLRDTCEICARADVPCAPRDTASSIGRTARAIVCADCIMTGRG